MSASPRPTHITLYTIAMSHFSEKIRWLLDVEGVPYREVALTPVFHVMPALLMGGRARTTVPVLKADGRSVQDSTRIIEWLGQHGGLATLPADHKAEIMAIEDQFDGIGDCVVRYLYQRGFDHPEFILSLWTRFATPAQSRFLKLAYPLIKQVFKVKLWINEASARRAEQQLNEVVSQLERRLADGRFYLVGERLTVADITAAALLAPLACPPEHAVYGAPAFIEKMALEGSAWRDRPGMAWVRQMYAQHRGAFWAVAPKPA
jgi:glutathione S-transferase